MRLWLSCLLVIAGLGLLIAGHTLPSATADGGHVAVATIDGAIDPVNARYLSRSIDKATRDGAELLVVRLDTPGGLLSSTRNMVEALLSAEIPTAVYVSPPGARAASAGTFITAAANFAVMAPGTNIGAASPVSAGGQDLQSTMARKINEDTRAFIRSIADARDRNGPALEATVTEARSYSAAEAVGQNVVDFIAGDLSALLAQVDGRTAQTAAGLVVVQTQDADVRDVKRTLLENFLGVISNPNLAFVLLTIGGIGILIELLTPGLIGPGVLGVIFLGLAFTGMGQLPVNWLGVGLIVFALLLFFLELHESGLGVLGIGGVICFVLGGFLLFGGFFTSPDIPEPSFRVNSWVIGITGASMTALVLAFVYLARPTGSATGYVFGLEGGMIGQSGVALSDLTPVGKVRLDGQEWMATSDFSGVIPAGEEVTVVGVYGNVLKVSQMVPELQPEVGSKDGSLVDRLFPRRRQRKVRGLVEEKQKGLEGAEQAELDELRLTLQRGFSDIGLAQGLKALEELTYEYQQLLEALDRRKEADPLAIGYIPALAEETYRQGLSVLANGLHLAGAIQSSDTEALESEITELEREIEALRRHGGQPEQISIREETIASHRERLDLVKRQRLRLEELLRQSDRCEASLHRTRAELAVLKADSMETRVTMVTETLSRTIDQAREVQEELRKLGF